MSDRHTVSGPSDFIEDTDERAALEAENALLQFDRVLDLIDESVRDGRPFRLRPSTILTLHAVAMNRVHKQAGTFRNTPVSIEGSAHQPPGEHVVAVAVEDLCEWVNANFLSRSAVELCAHIMWRLNWIHPFADGNGRTTRAVAYLVLCVRAGARLPGAPTIPEQIAENKTPYYDALEAADKSSDVNAPEIGAMTSLLRNYLEHQLEGVLTAATTSDLSVAPPRRFH